VNTLLFSFQDLKLNTKDIIAVLKDTLNTTSSPLPIPNPHATWVPSNTLDKHSIGSCVVDDVRNLITSSNMAKLWKSMWQIRIAIGIVKKVLGENSDLIAFNFNEGIDQELCL